MACTEKEFVERFSVAEKDLIETACHEFVEWRNLHKTESDNYALIGLSYSILDMFQNPYDNDEYASQDLAGLLIKIIYPYKTIMIDNYAFSGGLEQEDIDYYKSVAIDCVELLEKLITMDY